MERENRERYRVKRKEDKGENNRGMSRVGESQKVTEEGKGHRKRKWRARRIYLHGNEPNIFTVDHFHHSRKIQYTETE